jgi:opacity protein-like surface antigen
MTFTPTTNFDIREDNILATGGNFEYFGGGFNYRLPVLSTMLNNASANLSGYRFQFYLTGSAGVDRISVNGGTAQHYGFLAGAGANYNVTSSGTWTLGGEVRYAKFPGFANNTVVVVVGPAIHF